jgi:polysaccharide deacetylase family protein (PEP-CTERM system associated)
MDANAASERPAELKHILSIDLEDYFHVEAFAGVVSREEWDRYPSRVERNCHRLLDIFDDHSVKATFFVLGWIAQRFPALVREVHQRGHELACHSYWHRKVSSLTPAEFRADTRAACHAIEQAASVRVTGYRAPTWSVTPQCLWALDILSEEGFTYDSSIFPIRHDLYGIPNASRHPYYHETKNGERLLELPPATVQIKGKNFPAAGGGWFRMLPFSYTKWAFRRFHSEGTPLVFYLHPWEIDPDQPRFAAPLKSKLRHYTNLGRTEARLERMLRLFKFQTFQDYVRLYSESCPLETDVLQPAIQSSAR